MERLDLLIDPKSWLFSVVMRFLVPHFTERARDKLTALHGTFCAIVREYACKPLTFMVDNCPAAPHSCRMDSVTALQNLALVLKSKAKVSAFLAKHSGLSLDKPTEALQLVTLATAEATAPRTRKPKLPSEVKEFKRRLVAQDFDRILHTAKTLALCSLPVDPQKERTIVREAVDERGTKVHVRFSSHDERIALPYGNDRAIITWLMTLAREHGSPKVEFDSAMQFFTAFGMADSGKNYADLREALERISNVVITYGYESRIANVDRDLGEKLVYDKQLPTRSDIRGERTGLVRLTGLTNYYIQFGEQTFKELVSTPVSIPLDILRRYRSSPTSWDLLNFIVAASANLPPGGEHGVSLKMVSQFLGSRDKNLRKLKQKVDQLAAEVGEYLNFSVIGRGTNAVVMLGELPEELRPKTLGHEIGPNTLSTSFLPGLEPEDSPIEGEVLPLSGLSTKTPLRSPSTENPTKP